MKWIQTLGAELWASECAEPQGTVWLCAFSVSYSTNKCKSSLFLQPLFAYKRTTFLALLLFKATKGISEKNPDLNRCCRICKCHYEIDSKRGILYTKCMLGEANVCL